MSALHVLALVSICVLVANGLRVVLGIPPVSYWFRSRPCPICDGVGVIRAHTHTGDLIEASVEDVHLASRAREPEAASTTEGTGSFGA